MITWPHAIRWPPALGWVKQRRYMKGWMTVDVLAVLPYFLVSSPFWVSSSSIPVYLRALVAIKLVKISRASDHLEQLYTKFNRVSSKEGKGAVGQGGKEGNAWWILPTSSFEVGKQVA